VSRENLEIVRRVYDAVARRDGATPFELYAKDIVWDMSQMERSALYKRPVYVGHEGVREMWRESLAAFGEIDFELESLSEAGEQVFAVVRERAVGRTSGAAVQALHYAVWTLAGGKVARLQIFDDRDQALEAAGLRNR
jgi:ketosteroid isomerase-like protein